MIIRVLFYDLYTFQIMTYNFESTPYTLECCVLKAEQKASSKGKGCFVI